MTSFSTVKKYTYNSKYMRRNEENTAYFFDFDTTLTNAKAISILDYDIVNTTGSFNRMNKYITIFDSNNQSTKTKLGEIGTFIDLEKINQSITLPNLDTVTITFDTDKQRMIIQNITNNNPISFDFTDNAALAALLGFEQKYYSGASSHTGLVYPSNGTDYINIICDNIKDRDTSVMAKAGVYSLFKVRTVSRYGYRLYNDFSLHPDNNLIKTLKEPTFDHLTFRMMDEYGNILPFTGNFSFTFRLYF